MTKYYSYFFTRQDMSPEQQIVQTAHAAMCMGVWSQRVVNNSTASENTTPIVPYQVQNEVVPENTYFTVIGVRNEPALESVMRILDHFGYRYEAFCEPDMGGTITSVALYPISEYHRDVLLAFDLLKVR